MKSREDIERQEYEILAPYAMKSGDSAGREFPEPDHPVRTCYQRDRDRIVHSEAFRKLEYKTQVFVIFEGDYYRTRLTHTIEVAQIGRTIGRSLGLNEELIEAVALAHDLGHPPFGHAGEFALSAIMQEAGLAGFNHNLRSFEIVTKYEKRYPDFDGLNLSQEVLVGILKHSSTYDLPGESKRYADHGPTLEARVVDLADSLAYLNHDIDDGITSGCISAEDLTDSELWQQALSKVSAYVDVRERDILKYQIVKQLIDMQIRDLLAATDARLQESRLGSSEAVQSYTGELIGFSAPMKAQRDFLQSLLNEKLYRHYRVVRMTSKAERIIRDLFTAYVQEPEQLPYAFYQRGRTYAPAEKYATICHYIAQMTDRFALEEHRGFFNPYAKV